MIPFLKQVAAHYIRSGNIDRRLFIFPNRRSIVFFNRYLAEEVKAGSKPVVAPLTLTINDFMSKMSGLRLADKVHQLLVLYDCYKELNPACESLDDFIFWGDVLLGDFDDVDKYMADPVRLFSNIADIKSIQDDMSYLSDVQKQALERFLRHFESDGDRSEGKYKEKFLQIWRIMYPLYAEFRNRLEGEGLAYEGMNYRMIAERLVEDSAVDILAEYYPGTESFVFVGLNALSECERRMMISMKKAGLAEFCWDYCSDMISDPANKSSLFMRDNIVRFPQAFELEESAELPETNFNVLSVSSAVGQAKQLPEIFRRIGGNPGLETAVILPEEELLVPVINSIPPVVGNVNVTMGCTMSNSALFQLLGDIAAMQLKQRVSGDGGRMFYHKPVWEIFSNTIFKTLLDEGEKEKVDMVRHQAKYYIPQTDLNGGALLDVIFRPIPVAPDKAEVEAIRTIQAYQLELIRVIGMRLRDVPDLGLELEFARAAYNLVQKLSNERLELRPVSYFSLFARLSSSISVPFNGEPLKGLQIMGPLETRSLDFDNLIILSCNEGLFPRRSVSGSFVPAELRKGFGLPTYEYQDAVWAYYFYRMIQRASNVWFVYDSRSEMGRSGEESRYIKQLEMHFGRSVNRFVAESAMSATSLVEDIPKTAEDIAMILSDSFHLSASSLNNYISCPARFYYASIKKLRGAEDVVENLDNGMIGNVLHGSMEDLYRGRKKITRDYLQTCLRDEHIIIDIVRARILNELGDREVRGRNLILEEMVRTYVRQILVRDCDLMDSEGVESFEILGLEKQMDWSFGGFRFTGMIDRLDSFHPGTIRVVDYKTGKVKDKDTDIKDENADGIVNALYGDREDIRPKIAFQVFLYDKFVSSSADFAGKRIVNSVYQTNDLFKNPVKNVDMSGVFCDLMESRLAVLLDELRNPAIGFSRAEDLKACDYCDFKKLCGR